MIINDKSQTTIKQTLINQCLNKLKANQKELVAILNSFLPLYDYSKAEKALELNENKKNRFRIKLGKRIKESFITKASINSLRFKTNYSFMNDYHLNNYVLDQLRAQLDPETVLGFYEKRITLDQLLLELAIETVNALQVYSLEHNHQLDGFLENSSVTVMDFSTEETALSYSLTIKSFNNPFSVRVAIKGASDKNQDGIIALLTKEFGKTMSSIQLEKLIEQLITLNDSRSLSSVGIKKQSETFNNDYDTIKKTFSIPSLKKDGLIRTNCQGIPVALAFVIMRVFLRQESYSSDLFRAVHKAYPFTAIATDPQRIENDLLSELAFMRLPLFETLFINSFMARIDPNTPIGLSYCVNSLSELLFFKLIPFLNEEKNGAFFEGVRVEDFGVIVGNRFELDPFYTAIAKENNSLLFIMMKTVNKLIKKHDKTLSIDKEQLKTRLITTELLKKQLAPETLLSTMDRVTANSLKNYYNELTATIVSLIIITNFCDKEEKEELKLLLKKTQESIGAVEETIKAFFFLKKSPEAQLANHTKEKDEFLAAISTISILLEQ